MKKPTKLWPLRPATRAGQNANATQMIEEQESHDPPTQTRHCQHVIS